LELTDVMAYMSAEELMQGSPWEDMISWTFFYAAAICHEGPETFESETSGELTYLMLKRYLLNTTELPQEIQDYVSEVSACAEELGDTDDS